MERGDENNASDEDNHSDMRIPGSNSDAGSVIN